MPGLLKPRALRPGDTVAVAALSGGLEQEEAQAYGDGARELQRTGFDVQVSPLVELGRHDRWSAGRPAEVAAELNRLLADPQVRAVFALTGGRTTFSYLDLVDLDAVRADPKPIVGFSDIGGLQLALFARTGLVSVHGDLVTHGFGYRHELPDTEADCPRRGVPARADGPHGTDPAALRRRVEHLAPRAARRGRSSAAC